MEFNDKWTKEVNKRYRNLIKEGKTQDEIKEILGDVVNSHPQKRFIKGYSSFLMNEIFYTEKKTLFQLSYLIDEVTERPYYKIFFDTISNNKYVLLLHSDIDKYSPFPNKTIYHISVTLEDNLSPKKFDNPTNNDEFIELIKRISFIIQTINKNYIYVIGDTMDVRKINIYRDVMKSFMKNEIEGPSSRYDGRNAYYYFDFKDKDERQK